MTEPAPESFRDPSGFVFTWRGLHYRQVNRVYQEEFERLIGTGLYEHLVSRNMFIPHQEVADVPAPAEGAYKILLPEQIPFISYPYEWSFGELKGAALLTLEAQQVALRHGMSLKDANAYNVQFRGAVPVHIDTLSFETYRNGEPWIAYRQFCQHFLGPLALMAYVGLDAGRIPMVFPDGIPIDLASSLLPARTVAKLGLAVHMHFHARSARRAARLRPAQDQEPGRFSPKAMTALIENLIDTIRTLRIRSQESVWSHYQLDTSYSQEASQQKLGTVREWLHRLAPPTALDIGANRGVFSRIAVDSGATTLAWDADVTTVDASYSEASQLGRKGWLPIVVDLAHPTPPSGWAHSERPSALSRGRADTVLMLAVLHHVVLGGVPLDRIAQTVRQLCRRLIVEFVDPDDHQVKTMRAARLRPSLDYSQASFERAFSREFSIVERVRLPQSLRTLYLLE